MDNIVVHDFVKKTDADEVAEVLKEAKYDHIIAIGIRDNSIFVSHTNFASWLEPIALVDILKDHFKDIMRNGIDE